MKILKLTASILIAALAFTACNTTPQKQKTDNIAPKVAMAEDTTNAYTPTLYSTPKLIAFLDSLNQTDDTYLVKDATKYADSVLYNQQSLHHTLSATNYSKLKAAIKETYIDTILAKKIFPVADYEELLEYGLVGDNKIAIKLWPLDSKNEFSKFGLAVGSTSGISWGSLIYFFNNNTIIAKHQIYHRYGVELKSFKSTKGSVIVYYNVNFGSGTGIWANNLNFYEYTPKGLQPVLSVMYHNNLWGLRAHNFNLEGVIKNTNPLKIQYTTNNQFRNPYGDISFEEADTTLVTYIFNKQQQKYQPDFSGTELSAKKLSSYSLDGNIDLLFAKSYSRYLKEKLMSTDTLEQKMVQLFVSDVLTDVNKNH